MNPTEQLLNRYGLTMKNPNYEEGMKGSMVKIARVLTVEDPDERQRRSILYAFLKLINGIHIKNLELFKNKFQIEQAGICFPDCLWDIAQIDLHPTGSEHPFKFDVKRHNDIIDLIDSALKERNAELQPYLKRFRVQEAFKSAEQLTSPHVYFLRLFYGLADKLYETSQMKEFNSELTNHLFEKFLNKNTIN